MVSRHSSSYMSKEDAVIKGSIYDDDILQVSDRHRTSSKDATTGSSVFTNGTMRETELTNVTSPLETRSGLNNVHAISVLCLWYFFSFTTLILNKYILSFQKGDPVLLGCVQLLICFLCGYLHIKYSLGHRCTSEKFPKLYNIVLVGSLRFSTVFLGLIALWYVTVSFAETVKSCAPIFTVIISFFVLGETTTFTVKLSLLPVMGGLALCSANDLSFNVPGFISSLATNLSECFQNVFSKRLLSDERKLMPAELQCFTGLSSVFVQIPAFLIFVNIKSVWENMDLNLLATLLLGGLSFHLQSFTEYVLLGYISPVTHSVANTVKRALMIWLSILIFGNPVTFLSGLGTIVVFMGVLMYNHARNMSPKATHIPLTVVKVTDHDV